MFFPWYPVPPLFPIPSVLYCISLINAKQPVILSRTCIVIKDDKKDIVICQHVATNGNWSVCLPECAKVHEWVHHFEQTINRIGSTDEESPPRSQTGLCQAVSMLSIIFTRTVRVRARAGSTARLYLLHITEGGAVYRTAGQRLLKRRTKGLDKSSELYYICSI